MRYKIGLETSTRGNNFIFDSVQLLYYKCYKINFKRGRSYIESPDKIKTRKQQKIQEMKMMMFYKKATKNPKNEDDKCFQYAPAVALNHEEIKRHKYQKFNLL